MKRVKNRKDCNRGLVLSKRNFVDVEKIKSVEKPLQSNYELQREFLEKNADNYKNKIERLNDIFKNDHERVMKEKRQLISIKNQLEKDKKEANKTDNYNSKKLLGMNKSKGKIKPGVPKFPYSKKKKTEDNNNEDDELKLKELADELKRIVKEIQLYKYWDKKQKIDKVNKNKTEKKIRIGVELK